MSLPHKPFHTGDLEDDFLNYVIKLYNDDELREDNYLDVVRHLNEYLHRNHEDKNMVESVRQLFKAVSSLNIKEEEEKD